MSCRLGLKLYYLASENAWLRSVSWLLVSVMMNRNSVSTLNIPSSANCNKILVLLNNPPCYPLELQMTNNVSMLTKLSVLIFAPAS